MTTFTRSTLVRSFLIALSGATLNAVTLPEFVPITGILIVFALTFTSLFVIFFAIPFYIIPRPC